MNLKVARLFVLFTGFLALCSVGAAALLGLRLRTDRAVWHEMQRSDICAPDESKRKGDGP